MKRLKIWMLAAALLAFGGMALAKTSVRVVIPFYSAATEPFFKKMKAEFEAKNPDIEVALEVVNWDNLFQKLTTDIAANKAPDLSIIGTRWLLDFQSQGVAEPLDSYMSPEFKGSFIPTFLKPSVLGGKTYGLPIAASARAMYYNKDLLAKAGLKTPPATWDELYSQCKTLVAKVKDAYCFGLQGKEIETDAYWYYALWSFGGEIFGPDGKSAINSQAGIQAADFYSKLIKEKLTQPGPTGYSRENVQDLFKQGRVAFVITAPFLVGQITKDAPKLQYGITAIPKAKRTATYGVTDTIMLFSSSKVKKEANAFMEYVLQAANHVQFTKAEGFLPLLSQEAKDPAFQTPSVKAFSDLLPYAEFAPVVPDWEKMADLTSRALQSIYLGQKSSKAALDAAVADINKILK